MKKIFSITSILILSYLQGVNILPDGQFQQIKGNRLVKWQSMTRWAGKNIYRHTPGILCIERPENDKGAGAYMSSFVPVVPKQNYLVKVDYNLISNNSCRTDLAINWYDINQKKIAYHLIKRVSKVGKNKLAGKVTAPSNAAFGKVLLVMAGAGSIEFSNAVMDDGKKELPKAVIVTKNLLPNPNFKIDRNGLPLYWQTSRWPGKTQFSINNNHPVINRQEDINKAGAFLSTPIKLKNVKIITISGEISTNKVSTNSDIAVQFFNTKGKVCQYHLIGRVKGNMPWKKFSKIINVPAEAISVRMLLVQCGTGTTTFRNLLISDKLPEVANARTENSYILNGSFEEADLNPSFVDCFNISKGSASRIADAIHGYHALQLSPKSVILYGSESKGSIAIKANEKLFLSIFTKGNSKVNLLVTFFDTKGKIVEKKQIFSTKISTKYQQNEFQITPPKNATSLAIKIINISKNYIKIDALHLGRKKFDAKKVATMPRFEFPKPVATQKFPTNTIKNHKGIPAWFIDGKVVDYALYTLSDVKINARKKWLDYVNKVLKVGQFPILVIPVSITPENSGEHYTLATAMRDIDVQVRTTLAEIPDAKFILWTMLEPSNAFANKFPQDILQVADSSLKWKDHIPPYSYGSEAWGRACAVRIAELLNAVSKTTYANRIVGMSPGMGKFGENNFGHAVTVGGYSPHDFSPAMVNFFRKWLFMEYQGDVQKFAQAWNKPGINFNEATTPNLAQRLDKDGATFFNVKTNRQTIDYVRCESFAILHRVLQQCEAAKKITNGKIFTFAQFAYFTGSMYQRELDYALKNPYLDSMGPAPPYINRGPGDDIPDHGPAASVQANGKVWLFQADVRTHLSSEHNWKYGRTNNEEESVSVFLRDLGHYMSIGSIPYYMTFEAWYDSPKMLNLVSRFNELLQLSAKFPRPSLSEIAVVIDPVSLAIGHEYSYVRRIMPPQQSTLEYNRTFEWHKLGAPYDFYMLDDLLALKDISRYKVVIFASNWCISNQQRKLIKEKLQKNNRTLIWFFAPGIFRKVDNLITFDSKNANISGFEFDYDHNPGNLEIKLPDGRKYGKFTTDIYGGFTIPTRPVKVRNETFRPRLIVKKTPGVEILGNYASDNLPGFARKKGKEHTDIFWGSSALNKEVLIPLLKAAGIHIYTDTPCVVYANKNFISIHNNKPTPITLTLPQKVDVIYDLYQEKILARNSSTLTTQMKKNSSLLLYYGNFNALKLALSEIRKNNNARIKKNLSLKSKFQYTIPEIKNLAKKVNPQQLYPVENDGTIRYWQILGSFPGYTNNGYGFSNDFIGEQTFNGNFNKKYNVVFTANNQNTLEKNAWFKGKNNQKKYTISWEPLKLSKNIVRAMYQETSSFPFYEYITYYASCYVVSNKERDVILSIGSDDGEKTFFNGKLVTSRKIISRRLQPDSEQGIVKLKKGKNLLLVKVCQGGGGVGHMVRFLDPENNNKPVTDIKITLQ